MKELLPCPFCGREASYGTARLTGKIAELNERTEGHFVNCITCGANNNILNLGYATKEKAKEQWNARAEQKIAEDTKIEPLEREPNTGNCNWDYLRS